LIINLKQQKIHPTKTKMNVQRLKSFTGILTVVVVHSIPFVGMDDIMEVSELRGTDAFDVPEMR
jgi:hypothetical protein